VGPYFLGYMKDLTGGFGSGLVALAALAFVGGLVTLRLRVDEEKLASKSANEVMVH
jgi:cyanate permease